MPVPAKVWLNYPPNTSTPVNAPALVGLENRVSNYVGAAAGVGPGVFSYEDFRVKQHGGGDMTVDVGLAATPMAAYIALDALGSIERYDYNGLQLNQSIAAADPTNPRVDRLILLPNTNIDSQVPTTSVVTGIPTAAATLDNLNGAQALAPGRLLLADILVPAASVSVTTANIRDRRQFPLPGTTPALGTMDRVSPVPHPQLMSNDYTIGVGLDQTQVAALFFLPRRIVGVSMIRTKYTQTAAAITGNFNIGIFDASGRLIISTGVLAFGGAVNTTVNLAAPITPTTFEAGNYYIGIGLASLATGSVNFHSVGVQNTPGSAISPATGGIAYRNATGGTTLPNWIGNFTDVGVATVSIGLHVVPMITLSVG